MEHTSRELSQRLKDKRFRGEHTHYYCRETLMQDGVDYCHGYPKIPAYTFNELWGVLPDEIKGDYEIALTKDDVRTYVCYEECSHGEIVSSTETFAHESPTEAIGILLEWLIDKGHCDTNGGEA
jgi:hypothetical protein